MEAPEVDEEELMLERMKQPEASGGISAERCHVQTHVQTHV